MKEIPIDKKTTEIFYYWGMVFWLIAYLAGDKNTSLLHKNQGLVIALIAFIPSVGTIIWLIYAILGTIAVANNEEKELPIICDIKLIKE